MPPLNVLYLHSHDTGRYVQPYGHAVHTPELQRLAEEGTLFRQAFCVQPTCSPSRGALLTGTYPHQNGLIGLTHRGFALRDPSQHLSHYLRAQGYLTALAGVQHETADLSRLGYDQILPKEAGQAGGLPAALAFLATVGHERPFFLTVGFHLTHRAFPPPDPADDARYTLPPAGLPDCPAVREDMAAYKTSARHLDAAMGQVLAALATHGHAAKTLVICTTDHGIAFPRMKCNLTDAGLGVMLMLRGPGIPVGRVSDAMVSHLDIFPTLCDLLGTPPPAWLQGASLLPHLRGGGEVHEAVFGQVNYHGAYDPQRSVRTTRWKYIRRFDDRQRAITRNCDGGPSKEFLLAQEPPGWVVAREELYDLVFDPTERQNLATSPAHHGVLAEMRDRLARWMAQTNDPVRHGPIPPPPGAKVESPDDR